MKHAPDDEPEHTRVSSIADEDEKSHEEHWECAGAKVDHGVWSKGKT